MFVKIMSFSLKLRPITLQTQDNGWELHNQRGFATHWFSPLPGNVATDFTEPYPEDRTLNSPGGIVYYHILKFNFLHFKL